jgi:hypothetical protein
MTRVFEARELSDIYNIVFPASFRLEDLEASVTPNNTALTKQKIASFKNLPSGWHYGEGVAPTQPMIDNAHDWHKKIAKAGFTITNAFPGVGGEIMISGRHEDHEVEIVLESDGSISFDHEKNDQTVTSIERGNPKEVEDALNEAAGELWSISDFSINDILSRIKIASTDWHFEITAAVLPSFYMNVLSSPIRPYAGTYENIIQLLPENRRYFGYWIDHQRVANHQFLLPVR